MGALHNRKNRIFISPNQLFTRYETELGLGYQNGKIEKHRQCLENVFKTDAHRIYCRC
jgi:hypothetical protein